MLSPTDMASKRTKEVEEGGGSHSITLQSPAGVELTITVILSNSSFQVFDNENNRIELECFMQL